ncbi:MAG TPA: ABC transporter permease [Anaerolineales bacterium]|nr:ABC transporter permease [Anaerolineales bacterium]
MATDTLPIRPAPGALDISGITLREYGRLEKLVGPDWYRILVGLFTNPLSIAGMVIILCFLLVAAFAPVLAPPLEGANPYKILRDGFSPQPKPPGTEWKVRSPEVPGWYQLLTGKDKWVHLMGTSSGQWDIYYGIIWGTRTALWTGVLITAVTLCIGVLVGSFAAYYGGRVDDVLMRITEIFMAFPFFLAAITLSAALASEYGKTIWVPTAALVAFGWMTYARVVRGDILTVKERDYVTAARVIGAKDARIVLRHILPNAVFPTLVLASLDIGTYVTAFAALSFLGVGTEVGYADWGQIISFARSWILSLDTHWYIIVFPGAALIFFGLGWNLVGDALRDILDPKLRGVRG